jgi:XTP/dITP diphosphohydrolase
LGKLKLKEGRKSVLEGVPKSLPALVKASRIQDKVKGVGFDWEEPHQVWDKVGTAGTASRSRSRKSR